MYVLLFTYFRHIRVFVSPSLTMLHLGYASHNAPTERPCLSLGGGVGSIRWVMWWTSCVHGYTVRLNSAPIYSHCR